DRVRRTFVIIDLEGDTEPPTCGTCGQHVDMSGERSQGLGRRSSYRACDWSWGLDTSTSPNPRRQIRELRGQGSTGLKRSRASVSLVDWRAAVVDTRSLSLLVVWLDLGKSDQPTEGQKSSRDPPRCAQRLFHLPIQARSHSWHRDHEPCYYENQPRIMTPS